MSKGRDYLLVVDSFSSYPEVALLKSICARHGIPEKLITDNGPQFSSRNFKAFVTSWKVKHVTSSPRYPQSNGHAERAVQTIKNILKKAHDPYLGLLQARIQGLGGWGVVTPPCSRPPICFSNKLFKYMWITSQGQCPRGVLVNVQE